MAEKINHYGIELTEEQSTLLLAAFQHPGFGIYAQILQKQQIDEDDAFLARPDAVTLQELGKAQGRHARMVEILCFPEAATMEHSQIYENKS